MNKGEYSWVKGADMISYPCFINWVGTVKFQMKAFRKHLYKPSGVCRRCKHDRNAPVVSSDEFVKLTGVWF